MIYQYDGALAAPTMDIYDTGMLKSYIDAVKDDYNRGLAEQKEFMTKYGDFSSPFTKDVEWWNNTVNKPVQTFITEAAKSGIDMRSPEFRAALANLTNRMPYGEMNLRKQNARVGEEYLKGVAELQRAGKYNADFERQQLGGHNITDWDTSTMGAFTRRSPEALVSLTDFAKKSTEGLKPSYLRTSEDGAYDYSGISDETVRSTIGKDMKDYLESSSGKFHLSQIASQNGLDLNNDTDRATAETLMLDQASARSGKAFEVREANPYYQLKLKQDFERQMQNAKFGHDRQMADLKHKYDKELVEDKKKTKTKYKPTTNAYSKTASKQVVKQKTGGTTTYNEVTYTLNGDSNGKLTNANVFYVDSNGSLRRMNQGAYGGATFTAEDKIIERDGKKYMVGTIARSDGGKYYYKHTNNRDNKPITVAYLEVEEHNSDD